MRTYPLEFKEQLIRKLLAADGPSVAELSEQTGVGKSTLWAWLRQYRKHGDVAPGGQLPARGNKDKLQAIIATAAMNEAERAAWCRQHGLYVRQLDAWRQAFEAAALDDNGTWRADLARERQKTRALQKELQRKDKALAETAALLALSKKAQAIWGVDEAV